MNKVHCYSSTDSLFQKLLTKKDLRNSAFADTLSRNHENSYSKAQVGLKLVGWLWVYNIVPVSYEADVREDSSLPTQ